MIVSGCVITGTTTDMILPIGEQVIRRIIRELGIEGIIGDNIYINTDFNSSSTTMNSEGNALIQGNRIDCTVDYVMDPMKTKYETTTTVHRTEYGLTLNEIRNLECLFYDETVKTSIYEHTVPCEIEIKGTIKILDRGIVDAIFSCFDSTNGNRPMLADILYSYNVPDAMAMLMAYTYIRSGAYANKVKLVDYIFSKSENHIGYILNKNLNRNQLSFVVNKSEANFIIDNDLDDDKPQAVKNSGKSVNHYTISFTVGCQFTRPDSVYMVYPIIMNNELIDTAFLPEEIQTREGTLYTSIYPYISIATGILAIEKDKNIMVQSVKPLMVPFYDNYIIPYFHLRQFGFQPFLSMAFPLDLSSNVTIIQLDSNLGSDDQPIRIKPAILDILTNQGLRILTGQLPITIAFFADDDLIDPMIITVNNLTISLPNRDITKIYRMVMLENTKETDYVPSLRVLKAELIPSYNNTTAS